MNRGFQLHPDQASTAAPQVDALYGYIWLLSTFVTLLVFALVVYFALRYRRRSKAPPAEVPAPHWIENTVIAVLFVLGMSIFFWGAKVYFFIFRPPVDALDIHVIGKQWMWKIQHPSGRREINTLHVPINTPIRLTIASQDVIHSFFLPAMRVKMDAVPGRYTSTWFEATKVGEFHLFCAEYCGTEHSRMIGKIIVMEAEEYQRWSAGTSMEAEAPIASGAQLFQSLQCVTCHGVQAPTMAGLFGSEVRLAGGGTATADESYLRESILDSTARIVEGYPPIMPSYRGQVTEEQLMDLIAYIKSLRNPQEVNTPPRAAPTQPN